jgi:hypothetical protein
MSRSRISGWMIAAAVLATPGGELPAGERVSIGPSFRLYPSAVSQTETFILRHPQERGTLFASANTINLGTGFISEGIYVTTDGGTTWAGNDTCTGPPITFHRGDPGIAIDRAGRFVLIRLGFSPGLYAHTSTDRGRTWSAQRTVATNDQDRAALAADTDDASPWVGRTYAAWVRFSPPYPVVHSWTSDGGATWSVPAQVNAPSLRGQGGDLAIGAGGELYVTWAGVIAVSPFTEDVAGFARSSDGGATWTVSETAFDMNGIAGVLPQKSNIRVNGLPRLAVDRSAGPNAGRLYIVTTERNLAPAGSDPDIILRRSTDRGTTWSAGVRVNQDPVNNGKTQYFPAVHVDEGGGVNVLFYDDRFTTNDSAEVVLARSTDGGGTWSEHVVSDHRFRPSPIGGLGQGYQGDNISLTSVGDTLWPVWMDNVTGVYQIWTAAVRLSTLPTEVGEADHPSAPVLLAGYPNPFNPSTELEFTLPVRTPVSLRVVDLLGREVGVLAEGVFEQGVHRRRFDAAGRAGGVYIVRLTTDAGSVTRRLVLLR